MLRVMRANEQAGVGLSRLVHHAHAAGLREEVAVLAPKAAEEAARNGAHRVAAALYRLAVTAIEQGEPAARATLLEAAARELQLTRSFADAMALREQALALRRQLGDSLRAGSNLRLIGVLHSLRGSSKSEYQRYAHAAVDELEPLGASGELAKAYASLSDAYCARSEFDTAIGLGERAVRLAEHLNDAAARVLALHRFGFARLCRANDAEAWAQLEQALKLAIEHCFEGITPSIFFSLQTHAMNHHDYAYALQLAARGLAYCEAHDLDEYVANLRVRRAYVLMQCGRWDESEGEYRGCLALPNFPQHLAGGSRYALQRLAVRRGAGESDQATVALRDDEVDRYWQDMETQLSTVHV